MFNWGAHVLLGKKDNIKPFGQNRSPLLFPSSDSKLIYWAQPAYYCWELTLQSIWIRGTFRAQRACLICVSHDKNTTAIDERSCGNFYYKQPLGNTVPERMNNPHLNTSHKLYTLSVNEVTVSLCSVGFFSLVGSWTPRQLLWPPETGSCWSRDFLLSLWLRTQNVYSGLRNWVM